MGALAGKIFPCAALAKRRAGQRVTRIDKIRSVMSLEEMSGFQAELARRGERLSAEELRALLDRRAELRGRP